MCSSPCPRWRSTANFPAAVPTSCWPARAFVELIRNTPFLIQAMLLFAAFGVLRIRIEPMVVGGAIVAIGVAFAGQLRDKLPVSESDQPLDWILTEVGAACIADPSSN